MNNHQERSYKSLPDYKNNQWNFGRVGWPMRLKDVVSLNY